MLQKQFVTGINYWPARKAMYWWHDFDLEEVREDFKKIALHNFKVVRIFLTWEAFQPLPDQASPRCLNNLQAVADTARRFHLQIMPTLFCGHMSGVNWMPEWMLESESSPGRFRVYSRNHLSHRKIKNYYLETELREAQRFQAGQVAAALAGHEALAAFDLGNESSNCVIPPDYDLARKWLKEMTTVIKAADGNNLVTLGMHAEDLEEDRHLRPQDAAVFCDFLSMHGFPFYLHWVDDPLDYELPPFLALITRWLGVKPVLLQEFGAPVESSLTRAVIKNNPCLLKNVPCPEDDICSFYLRTIQLSQEEGIIGAFIWCFGDYHPVLWDKPPLQEHTHERYFGVFDHHDSPKKGAAVLQDLGRGRVGPAPQSFNYPWLKGFDRDSFYRAPQENLRLLFKAYKLYRINRAKEV